MAEEPGPTLVGWGAVSALGMNASQTALMLRAGQNQVRESPFIDVWGERVRMSFAPTLPQDLAGEGRLLQLADCALRQAVVPVKRLLARGRVRAALALPERLADPRKPKRLSAAGYRLLDRIESLLHRDFPKLDVVAFPAGHAAGASALEQAMRWLAEERLDGVIVGGVDSYYDWDALEPLSGDDLIITPDNIDGLVPGEGAAFGVLVCRAALGLADAHPVARVAGVGTGTEPNLADAESACLAEGFTTALDRAASPLRAAGRRSSFWWTDLTHESYRLKEFQIVIARFGDILGVDTALRTPARELGDLGAATLPMFWALSAEAWRAGYASDSIAVCLAGSRGGERGATVLEAIE